MRQVTEQALPAHFAQAGVLGDLVAFEKVPERERRSADAPAGAKGDGGRIAELELELRSKDEYLQTTPEEMETTNEELKSTNEEMQSMKNCN